MTDKRCPDCKWSFKTPAPAGLNAPPLQCRRNPPNVSAFMVPGRLQGQAQIVTNASFPPVDATTWCGEFMGEILGGFQQIKPPANMFSRRLYSDDVNNHDHLVDDVDRITTPEQPQATSAD